jgi:hypothetical protein
MWSRHPGFTNGRIRACLTSTAVKLGPGTFDDAWGFGRVDAEQALRCGDLSFPDFTPFTDFTRFTRFTPVTDFTMFTRFTRTPFTRFTLFTPRTRFTPFTRFTRFTVGPDPFGGRVEPGPFVRPFVRFANTIFAVEDLDLDRFEDFEEVAGTLRAAGVHGLDDLACTDAAELAGVLEAAPEDVAPLVEAAQQRLRHLAGRT